MNDEGTESYRLKDRSDRKSARLRDTRARHALNANCCGFFLVVLDSTALNVAVTSMQRDFGGALTSLQWVVSIYTMVFASLMLTCGAIGDRIGPKRLYQIGLIFFTITSLLCALATGPAFLIAARFLQGIGAAIMLPSSLSLISHAYPNAGDRAKAIAHWASVVSLAFAVGPVLGGVLTSYFGWRSIFLINIPVGVLALCMVRKLVSEASSRRPQALNVAGQVLVSASLFCLTYALIEAGGDGWTSPHILTAFGAWLVLTVAIIFLEKNDSLRVFPSFLIAKPSFSTCVVAGLVLNFGIYGILFVEALYLQDILHLNALLAGATMLPLTLLPTITTRLIVGYSEARYLKGRIIIGQIIAACGAGMLIISTFGSAYWQILLGLALLGVSLGCIMPAITAGILIDCPTENSGLASGILNAARQVGGALGVALMGSLFLTWQTEGLLASFALVMVSFLGMAGITARKADWPGTPQTTGPDITWS